MKPRENINLKEGSVPLRDLIQRKNLVGQIQNLRFCDERN